MAKSSTNWLHERKKDGRTLIDPERGPIIKKMFERVDYEQWSGRKLYNWIKFDLNFKSAAGKKNLSLGNIYRILSTPFYYGIFEYPKNSGNWYTGKHEPIITKELFDLVQKQIKSQVMRVEGKEFAFTKMMTCGLCGSGICADEKFKKLKNGDVARYVYYGCTKARGVDCKCGYTEEKEVLKQFNELIGKISLNEIEVKEKIKVEIQRFSSMQKFFLGTKEGVDAPSIDVRGYAKYVLKEGTNEEKREILGCLKSRIYLAQKKITLEK